MATIDSLRAEISTLRSRLAGLTEAILRISEDLDLDTVLQEVVDSARTLTGARYAAITTIDDVGELQDALISGLSEQEHEALWGYAAGTELFGHLSGLREPLRTSDFVAYAESAGFPGFQPQIGAFLTAHVSIRDRRVGTIYIGEKHDDSDFTPEDEEILQMFASQAATALTNARRYGDEQRAKADLEALVDTSPVGVLVVDVHTQSIVMVNEEAHRLIQIEPEHGGFSVASLRRLGFKRIDGSQITLEELPFEQSLLVGETVHAEELSIVRPDGSEVATFVNATPIHSEDGELVSVIATIQDMSPLAELERLRAEFLAMVSHELRVPLTSIKGSAATMRSASTPPDAAEVEQFFSIVEEQADHMRDLVNNLLDMTRIEAGALSVSQEPADLAAVVDQAKRAFVSSGHRHHVEVELAAHLPRVWCDKQRITQVFHNLFVNAAHSSREWSMIRVSASSDDGDQVTVAVSDEGIGIAPDQLPLLFTKFPPEPSDVAERAVRRYGLGLAICKGIVESHGGRIWAASAGLGHGAQFTFTVPVLADQAVAEAESESGDVDSCQTATRPERILVIDDDPQALRVVRTTLERAGYATVATSDPGEVAQLLAVEMPHLVLLDIVLPLIDGFELVRREPALRELPFVFLSGRGDDQLVARAFELGAADYIVKPFSPVELLARISAILRRRAQWQHIEPYRSEDLVVDFLTRRVTLRGDVVNLTPTEYKLLAELCMNAGRPLSHERLLELVWGHGSGGSGRRVRTFVKDLRAKLGDDAKQPTYILTVPGVGYCAAAR